MHKGKKHTPKEKYIRRSIEARSRSEKIESFLIAFIMLICSLLVTVIAVKKPFGDFGGSAQEEMTEGEEENVLGSSKRTASKTYQGKIRKLESPQTLEPVLSREGEIKKQVLLGAGMSGEDDGKEKEPLIIIDPGHGGMDEGCINAGVKEKDVNLQIALLVRDKLEEMGMRVSLTREKDTYLAKEERAAFANQEKGDAFISIHQNTFEDAGVCGIETWYDGTGTKRESQRLAQLVHEQTLKSTGAKEREIRGDADFHVTSNAKMPACLIETGFLSGKEEKKNLTDAKYQDKLAEGIAQGIYLFFNPKTMYLTFDDGPSAECTDMVLNILRERNIKATFFLIGEYVEKYPETAKRIADEGHTIGIHCYRHDYGELYRSVDSYLADFQKAYDAVEAATGVRAKIFRFPGGSVNAYNKSICKEIIEKMTERGFVYFDWNASLDDAVGEPTPEELLVRAEETTLDRKKVIMLAHDRVYSTAMCLDRLLTQFPEYKMEVLSPDVEPIKFVLPK
ncbi:MAG: N-acetylmuramoyl-L-alanine amidase [Lachnospiraceae bacterium]|nr:N-acetylmuramoyl-L-alanine amidase [Lachnospiraceae bacterium]